MLSFARCSRPHLPSKRALYNYSCVSCRAASALCDSDEKRHKKRCIQRGVAVALLQQYQFRITLLSTRHFSTLPPPQRVLPTTKEVTKVQRLSNWLVGLLKRLLAIRPHRWPSQFITWAASWEPRTWPSRLLDELLHYYHGFRLLLLEVRVAIRLLWKLLTSATPLTRRERNQLFRTVGDIFKLVPFVILILIPAAEVLLPVIIKTFPNMLPSTFETKDMRDNKLDVKRKQLKAKIEIAKFMQSALKDSAATSGDEVNLKDFGALIQQVRTEGEDVHTEQIVKYAQLFRDELTLDKMSMPQLRALCQVVDISPTGPEPMLRFLLRMKMRRLHSDDVVISREGVENLTAQELQAICHSRGMKSFGLSEDKLREQVSEWLDLHLKQNVPLSLILYSRALYLPEDVTTEKQLSAAIAALPESASEEIEYTIADKTGAKGDRKERIAMIKEEEKEIVREKEEAAELKKEAEEQKLKESPPDVAVLIEDKAPITTDEIEEREEMETHIVKEDLAALERVIETAAASKKLDAEVVEIEELHSAEEKRIAAEEDRLSKEEVEEGTLPVVPVQPSKVQRRLQSKVDSILSRIGKQQEELTVQEQLLDVNREEQEHQRVNLQETKQHLMSTFEIMTALNNIESVSPEKKEKILKLIKVLDEDHDGFILLENVRDMFDLLEVENMDVSDSQLKEVLHLIKQERTTQDESAKKVIALNIATDKPVEVVEEAEDVLEGSQPSQK